MLENLPVTMTPQEARTYVDAINAHLTNARALLLELYERQGWRALGYESWRECVTSEFGKAQRTLYQELEAAKVERNLCAIAQTPPARQLPQPWPDNAEPETPDDDPYERAEVWVERPVERPAPPNLPAPHLPTRIGQIPESHLRPLTPLPPTQQREVWQRANETAPGGKLTAAHVQATVDATQQKAAEEEAQQLFESLGDPQGRIAFAKLKAAYSTALYGTRSRLLALEPDAIANLLDGSDWERHEWFDRDMRGWLDNIKSARQQPIRIIGRTER